MAGKIRPEQVAAALVVLLGVLTLWNTLAYPAGAGYDAHSHWEYADFLIEHHRLPHRNETPEYYSPPAYFAVAGAATWIGRQVGLGEPHKLLRDVITHKIFQEAPTSRLLQGPNRNRQQGPSLKARATSWATPIASM